MKRLQPRTASCLIAAIFLVANLEADEPPVRGFDRSAYEYSFAIAERANDPEHWLREAEKGSASAAAIWEREAAAVYSDPSSLRAAELELAAWTEADLADRFSAWLRDRFFGREAARLRDIVVAGTASANARYLYLSDSGGAIMYDEAGNPRYTVHVEGVSPEDDRAAWSAASKEALDEAIGSFGSGIAAMRPELLSYIPESQRRLYADAFDKAAAAASQRAATELDAIVAREERLFVARRTSDVWSLRNESESVAASTIASAIVRETGAECETGMAALNARIVSATAGTGDLAVAGTDWLESFRLQFERGLSAWQGAEERFMVRRLEWERDAARSFNAGQEAWALAYSRLEDERRAWEEKAGELLRSGEQAFAKASETLEADIAKARAEFERDATERISAGANRAEAWVDVYLQSGQAAASAREGALYWLSLSGSAAPALDSGSLDSWIALESSKPGIGVERARSLELAGDCVQMYRDFSAKAVEARGRLIADFNMIVGSGAGGLFDVMLEGASSEEFNLDAYQVELLHAKAVEGYWQKRTSIARAVYEYASDCSSGRATAGDNIRTLGDASAAYDIALQRYRTAQDSLEAAGQAIGSQSQAMSAAKAALAVSGDQLEKANAEYSILMAAMVAGGDAEFIKDELYASYCDLILDSGFSSVDGTPSEASLLAAYLEKARELERAESMMRSCEALREAVDGFDGEPGLSMLVRSVESITVPPDPFDAPLDVEAYGIAQTDPAYAMIAALLDEMRSRLSGESDRDEEIGYAYRALVVKAAEGALSRARSALGARLDGLALLGAGSARLWYVERSGRSDTGAGVGEMLVSFMDASRRALFEARARLELETVSLLLGTMPNEEAGPEARSLAASLPGLEAFVDDAAAEVAARSLRDIVSLIDACQAATYGELATAIGGLAEVDRSVASFVNGQGFFCKAGCDVATLYLPDYIEAIETARGRYFAYVRYGPSSSALDVDRRSEASDVLQGALSSIGLSAGFDFAGAESRLFAPGVDTALAIADISMAFDEAAASSPAWVARELERWKESVLVWAATISLYKGYPAPQPSDAYRGMLEADMERYGNFGIYLTELGGDNLDQRMFDEASQDAESIMIEARTDAALLAYSLVYEQAARESAEAVASGRKHWREYLACDALCVAISEAGSEADSSMIITASNWAEGALADAIEETSRSWAALEAAFTSWLPCGPSNELSVLAKKYMDAPMMAFDPGDAVQLPARSEEEYLDALENYAKLGRGRAEGRASVARLGGACAIAEDREASEARLAELHDSIDAARADHDRALEAYRESGKSFEAAGFAYDAAYTELKSLFSRLEDSRTSYETEDAICRWAGTAYLASSEDDGAAIDSSSYRSPAAELAYAKSSLARASTALAALVQLYDEGTEVRPYDDPVYEEAYEEYREMYRRLMLVEKAKDSLAGAYRKEYEENARAYDACQDMYARIGTGTLDEGYKPFLLVDDGGRLRLAYGSDYVFAVAADPTELEEYFGTASDTSATERYPSTAFRRNLDALSAWMVAKGFSESKARQWGLARDCVIGKLAAGSADFAALVEAAHTAVNDNLLGGHRFVLLGDTLCEILADYRSTGLLAEQENALYSMDDEERGWFDTYLALVLCGGIAEPVAGDGSGNETYDAFSYWSRRSEYEKLESEAVRELKVCEVGIKASAASYAGFIAAAAVAGALFFSAWLVPGFLAAAGVAYAAIIGFGLTVNGIDATRSVYSAEMADLEKQTSANVSLITESMAGSVRARKEYLDSCSRLAMIEGVAADGSSLDRFSIRSALAMTGELDENEMAELLELYSEFDAETTLTPANVDGAMAALAASSGISKRDSLARLERMFNEGETARLEAQDQYRKLYEEYLDGTAGTEELEKAARSAFGPTAASSIEHVSNLAAVLEENGAMQSLADLTARANLARFSAELSAREAEWEVLRLELYKRGNAWHEAGALIIARGRADFESGFGMIRQRALDWNKRFADEYETRQVAWDVVYASSLDEKLSWAARATEAANDAATGAVLALVGADAQASARSLDTAHVSAINFSDGACSAYDDALSKAGILGMARAFGAQSASVSVLPEAVRSGIAGTASWDSGRILAAAADFSERSSAMLAGIQSRIMAAHVREAAEAAVAGLDESVRRANENFSGSMNDLFVADGRWQKEGSRYVKDIVVHSTVARPYITERVSVAAYAYFALSAWRLQVDLSEGRLAGLDPGGIQALMAQAQREVARKTDEVFGTAQENVATAIIPEDRTRTFYRMKKTPRTMTRIVTRHSRDGDEYEAQETYVVFVDETDTENPIVKTMSPGSFGRHLGFDPTMSDDADPAGGFESLFIDPGSGELGRMLAMYIYWSMKEGAGWSEANKAFYAKDLWDDRDGWFKAPSIRGIADLGVTLAAGALSGGAALPALLGAATIGLSDNAVFGALDIAGGYKSWEEAGLEFGKSLAGSAINVMSAGVFNGYGGDATGFFSGGLAAGLNGTSGMSGVVGRTMVSGLRTTTSSLASGAIDAIRWDGTSLAWSGQAFSSSLQGGLVSASSSLAAGLVSGALDLQLEGFTGGLYYGGKALSALTGGLAGQVVNYSLAGKASFNLANFSMLGLEGRNGGIVSGGLLELSLGKDGLGMAIAPGGMDASLGALAEAAGGLETWGANARLMLSMQSEADDYASALRTLYSVGSGAREGRKLFDSILSGRADIALEAEGDFCAETRFDEASGMRRIVLGRDALMDSSRFGTNIILAHEAYRNGLDDGESGQAGETELAVLGHILASESLAATYGSSSLSEAAQDELRSLLAARGGDSSSLMQVLSGYESSGDYWKLTKEGRLVNDGRARLLVEIVNDDGTPGWRLAEGSDSETSVSASLVHYLGESRAMELLGTSLSCVSNYDDQTLRDVLNLDAVDIKVIRGNPAEAQRVISSASPGQLERLLGEALMKDAGIAWLEKESVWSGTGDGLSLTAAVLHGSSAVRSTGDGTYERYSITADIERYGGAYEVWKDGVKGEIGDGNTRVSFTKWDIDSGEQVATILAGGAWNSVDNSFGQTDSGGNPIGADQPYKIAFGPTIQGNTIAEGPLNLRWAQNGSSTIKGDVFIISDTRTIAGEQILVDGRGSWNINPDRWLVHSTRSGSSDGCIVSNELNEINKLYSQLQTWELFQGYSITGTLLDENRFAYGMGYRKGSWR